MLLGDASVESNRDYLPPGEAEAFPTTAALAATVNAIHVYVDTHNGARAISVGLYANGASGPGRLLAAAQISMPPAGKWSSAALAPVAIAAGTRYWIAILGLGGTLRYRDRASGPCAAQTSAQGGLRSLPSSWSPGVNYATCPLSVYLSGQLAPLEPVISLEPPAGGEEISGGTTKTSTSTTSATSMTATSTTLSSSYPSSLTSTTTQSTRSTSAISSTSTSTSITTSTTSAPPAPSASFTYSPSAPAVGQVVHLNGSGSSCAAAPCAYQWSDDGSPTPPESILWPLGSGAELEYAFSEAGTKYVRLTITDALGRVASVEHDIVVSSSGTTTSTSSTTAVTSSSTSSATTSTSRTSTVTTTSSVTTTSTSSTSTAPLDCVVLPSACGYPDQSNTGVPAGTTLTPASGEVVVRTPGSVVKGLKLAGTIVIEANDVHVEDSEITVYGSQHGCSEPCGGAGILVRPGVSGTVISHDTIAGGAESGENALEFCIHAESNETTVTYVYSHGCTLDAGSGGLIEDNYCLESFEIPGEHYECIYYGGGGGPITIRHNTLLNPHGQTAAIFLSSDFGNETEDRIEENLLAGGGFVIYGGGSGSAGSVLGPVIVEGNRFSRLYYPEGGYYGIAAYFNWAVTTWSGNVWDESLALVPE